MKALGGATTRFASSSWSPVVRYGVAVLAMLVAVGIKLLLASVFHQASAFLLLSVAVLVAAVFGGFGPGALASVLGALSGDYFFMEPVGILTLFDPDHTVLAGIFVAQGIAISAIAARLASARRRSDATLADARKVEETLRASEQKSKQRAEMLENAHDAIFTWELGGVIVYWNSGAERLYGWSREEAVGRVSHELLETEHPFSSVKELEEVLRTEGHWEGELVHLARDGRRVVVESRHTLTHYDDGTEFVLETNRDLTERNLAEDDLRQSEQRYKTLFESIDQGICVIESLFDENDHPIDYRFWRSTRCSSNRRGSWTRSAAGCANWSRTSRRTGSRSTATSR